MIYFWFFIVIKFGIMKLKKNVYLFWKNNVWICIIDIFLNIYMMMLKVEFCVLLGCCLVEINNFKNCLEEDNVYK